MAKGEYSSSIIEELHQHELDELEAEAAASPELHETLTVLQHEQSRRRALAIAAQQADLSTGYYDAVSGDQPTQPILHVTDNVWPSGPKFLHAPIKDVE